MNQFHALTGTERLIKEAKVQMATWMLSLQMIFYSSKKPPGNYRLLSQACSYAPANI
jgi:hypothetical protein